MKINRMNDVNQLIWAVFNSDNQPVGSDLQPITSAVSARTFFGKNGNEEARKWLDTLKNGDLYTIKSISIWMEWESD